MAEATTTEAGQFKFTCEDCIIEVASCGRILFSSLSGGSLTKFEEMKMPPREFWEELGSLLRLAEGRIEAFRHQHAIDLATISLLREELDKHSKMRFVQGNSRRAFFAGLRVGQMQARD